MLIEIPENTELEGRRGIRGGVNNIEFTPLIKAQSLKQFFRRSF